MKNPNKKRDNHKPADLTNKKFGTLTMISVESTIDEFGNCRTFWNIKCDCGKNKRMRLDHIKKAKSCGCQKYLSKKLQPCYKQ